MSKMIEGEVGWHIKTIHWTSAISGLLEFYSEAGWTNLPEPSEVYEQMYCMDVPWTSGDAVFTLVSLEVFLNEAWQSIDALCDKDSGDLEYLYDSDTLVIIEG